MYRAAAAYPDQDRERATAGLRGQLRLMAIAGGGSPDWATLVIEGPTEAAGIRGRTWFEWAASVEVDGGRDLTRELVDEVLPMPRRGRGASLSAVTEPQPPVR